MTQDSRPLTQDERNVLLRSVFKPERLLLPADRALAAQARQWSQSPDVPHDDSQIERALSLYKIMRSSPPSGWPPTALASERYVGWPSGLRPEQVSEDMWLDYRDALEELNVAARSGDRIRSILALRRTIPHPARKALMRQDYSERLVAASLDFPAWIDLTEHFVSRWRTRCGRSPRLIPWTLAAPLPVPLEAVDELGLEWAAVGSVLLDRDHMAQLHIQPDSSSAGGPTIYCGTRALYNGLGAGVLVGEVAVTFIRAPHV